MAGNPYKIQLGVKIDTTDINRQISNFSKNNARKIDLQFNTKKVQSQLDSIRKQIQNLGNIKFEFGAGTGGSAGAIGASLEEVAKSIQAIKASLGTLDDGGEMKSLLSSVNQISVAVDKASGQFAELNSQLSALAKKDFGINIGFKLGGSKGNAFSNNTAYGNYVRGTVIPQLRQQASALMKAIREQYSSQFFDWQDDTFVLDTLSKRKGYTPVKPTALLQKEMMDGSNLSRQMSSIREYINLIEEVGRLSGVNISGVTSGFTKTKDELIQDALDIQSGVKNAVDNTEEQFEKLKGLFGGGIDSKQLDSIVADLNEIKNALVGLPDEQVDGLVQTFNKLSAALDEFIANIGIVKTALGSGVSGAAGREIANGFDNSMETVKASANEASGVISKLKTTLEKELKLDRSSIDAITKDIKDLGFEVTDASVKMKNGNFDVTVKGVDSLGRAITEIRHLDGATGEISGAGRKISQSFKETENAFSKLKSLAKEMSSLEIKIAGLDADKNAAEINELTAQLNKAQTEYNELYAITSKNLNDNQIKELGQISENAANKVNALNAKLADTSAVRQSQSAYKEMLDIQKKIGSLSVEIKKLDTSENVNEINHLTGKLNELRADYDSLKRTFGGQLSSNQWGNLQAEMDETEAKLNQIDIQMTETRNNLAKKIKLGFNDGDFNVMSKIRGEAGKLTKEYPKLETTIKAVERAIRDMESAIGTGDEVADVNKLISAYETYQHALKNVENQLRATKATEQQNATSQKLADDIVLFQNKIDAWLAKYSAAAKQYGAQLLDLKAKAQNCDRTTLNHLEAELKQVDKAAEGAGLKMQSFSDRLKTQFSKYSSYFSIASVFMYASQSLRSMFEQVKLIDSAMTELKKVTNETDASYNKFLSNAAKRSKEIGTTIDGLVSSTADFARLGYGFEDAQGLAEVANIYAVVGDEIEGVEGATESLISTMAAFKNEMNGMSNTDFAMSIIDKFNEIGKLIA